MKIATFANARTAVEARKGIAPAFMCAFRSGAVMGFLLSSLGLLVLFLTIVVFKHFYGSEWVGLFEAITGYGSSFLSPLLSLSLRRTCFVDIFHTYLESYDVHTGALHRYGLGGSSIALFCRVGGGIYTKVSGTLAFLARCALVHTLPHT